MSITTDIDKAIVESDMLRNMIAVLDMVQSAAAPAYCNDYSCEWCRTDDYDLLVWDRRYGQDEEYSDCGRTSVAIQVMHSLRYVLPFVSNSFSTKGHAYYNIAKNVSEFPDLYGEWLYVEIAEAEQRGIDLTAEIEEYEARLMGEEIAQERREMEEAISELESDPDYIAYRNGEDIFGV